MRHTVLKKWVTKRVLTDKMIRIQYGKLTRIHYMRARMPGLFNPKDEKQKICFAFLFLNNK
jgi:hypothetical protein